MPAFVPASRLSERVLVGREFDPCWGRGFSGGPAELFDTESSSMSSEAGLSLPELEVEITESSRRVIPLDRPPSDLESLSSRDLLHPYDDLPGEVSSATEDVDPRPPLEVSDVTAVTRSLSYRGAEHAAAALEGRFRCPISGPGLEFAIRCSREAGLASNRQLRVTVADAIGNQPTVAEALDIIQQRVHHLPTGQ